MEQDEIRTLFKELKGILKTYEAKGGLTPKFDLEEKYDLWSTKSVKIGERFHKEIFFTSIVVQSDCVAWYFMPIGEDANKYKIFDPDLLKQLTGKSCFQLKTYDPIVGRQIKRALNTGYALFETRGWI